MGDIKTLTILHVEDDPTLAKLVQLALKSLGFAGDILPAVTVKEAEAQLAARERSRQRLDLILTDMQLPDGTGLEVLRRVRSSPRWYLTPVIVLSGETDPSTVNEAYALGANCYLPKLARAKGAMESIKALYQCWIDGALLPEAPSRDRAQEGLTRALRLRALTADFYLGLAHFYAGDPEQEEFWLERVLDEGNMSNLLAFFQGRIREGDVPAAAVERVTCMQERVENALLSAQAGLTASTAPVARDIWRWVLDVVEAWDEEIFGEGFSRLFPRSQVATEALKGRMVCQLTALASHALEDTQEPALRGRAEAVLAFAHRLKAAGTQPQETGISP